MSNIDKHELELFLKYVNKSVDAIFDNVKELDRCAACYNLGLLHNATRNYMYENILSDENDNVGEEEEEEDDE